MTQNPIIPSIALSIFFYSFFVSSLTAQDTKRMLINEVEGNEYKKVDYSKEGNQIGKQILEVGVIKKFEDHLRMPVRLYHYGNNGELLDSTKTVYNCNPADRRILVNLLSFSNHATGSNIKVNVKGPNAFYPVNPGTGWEMEAINFEMNIDKGLAGFLGGKSKIIIDHRRVVPNDTLQTEQYQINSKVDLGVYVLGIRIKEFGYRVIEIIDKNQGIIWQKFNSNADDSYFVIRLL